MLAHLLRRASERSRARRMLLFARLLQNDPSAAVLDVGGTAANWKVLPAARRVVLLNMPRAVEAPEPGFERVHADGCMLPFPDASFDFVFSNSVIEHVGGAKRQEAFAREIRRVGRRYFVQTPDYFFPLEPHLLTPLLHWLPAGWQRWLLRRASVWEWIERPSADRRDYYHCHYLDEIRLLTAREMHRLFPGARLVRERWMGLSKSLIAIRD